MEWDSVVDKLSSFGEKAGKGLKRLFGSENERFLRTLEPVVSAVNAKEEWAKSLDHEAIQAEVRKYREQVVAGEAEIDDFVAPMFAMIREAAMRTMGMRHYDVQIVGGYVMHQGKIAEMMTGEGKTLMATLALCLNSLAGRSAYLVTVNDYLAKRDAAWMKPIYEYMGLTVGSIQADMDPWERKSVYACDIVYGTNNEFGFDYLRDNMKTSPDQQVQKDLYFAIVDEVDSILIDESRTPLIISGDAEDAIGKYLEADKVARALVNDEHYEVKEKERSASLLEAGIVAAQDMLDVKSFYEPGFEDWPHYIENAIRAHTLYNLDKEYVVEEVQDQRTGQMAMEVIIVDEFTGRKMAGRRWSDGLHQAVEVKEGLTPKQETQTMATITFQNYFRMFDKLSGMTGTALTEAGEFHKIYGLDVVCVPTNLPIARADLADLVYRTEREKWNAICEEIEELNAKGQPILVGTASVESSEHVASLLRERNVKHEVLNAKNHEREAYIIAMAGEKAAITVATNMAGRGTDIKLGGNFEYRLETALKEAGLEPGDVDNLDRIAAIREEVKSSCDVDEAEVLGFGGLYVLGTERHEARRIDNQLRGRTGRQGNVGASRFFLSLEDPLMRIFYRDWTRNMMEKLGMTEGQAIESKMVSNAIARAQRKVEDRNFEIRKSLLEYDEVMDTQRKTIYGVRQEVLEGEGLKDKVLTMIEGCLQRSVRVHADDAAGLTEWCLRTFGMDIKGSSAEVACDSEKHDIVPLVAEVTARYEEREKRWGDELTRRIENYILLNAIDSRWKDHLKAIDALKVGIGLRSYGQEDPKTAYKKEGTDLFQDHLLPSIENEVASLILRIEVQQPEEPSAVQGEASSAGAPGGDRSLQPHGMVSGRPAAQTQQGSNSPQQLTPEQVELLKSRARKQVAQKAMSQPSVNASNAFDVMRRNKAMAEQKAAQQAKASGKPAPQPQPQTRPAALAGFEGVGRNDECPCGSGKKFKKCHGK
ncbi:MAG: preprotein translocase subunit SecA [Planctomycetota bacterium]|jgi:preprotein translocase subunit SecA